ncbi:hypothetical protein GWK08_18430 [Leptobacterium flavescens]|uniref:PDZ domain-containing protein n=1 Tax=Leptobacterium flavescens TaxID=472055 RepID=A0A6P0URA3_9FLAO|nr:retropepsin-like aspartic protease [Leptobacterium flavescens]NER15437.1 hypothetical protein [Leptobacterium flavescens]
MNRYYLLLLLVTVNYFSSFTAYSYVQDKKNNVYEIPFEYVGGLMVIKAKVNGVEGRFIFDNGATHSCFNKEFAERSKVSFRKRVRITDGNNNRTYVRTARVKQIEISEFSFSKASAYLIDTKKFFPCDPVDGIIGASIINIVNWKIDFKQQKMFISLKPFSEEGKRIKTNISSNNSTIINFRVDGTLLRTKVDTGFSGELKVNILRKGSLLRSSEIEKKVGISSLSVTGLGNIDTTYTIHRNKKLKYSGGELSVAPKIIFTRYLKYEARIGLEYFKKYNLIINSLKREYILSNPEETDPELETSYGVRIYPVEGKFKIIQIRSGEPFSGALNLMDEISFIDKKPADRFDDWCQLKEYLRQKTDKKESLFIRLGNRDKDVEIPYKKVTLQSFN